MAMNAHPELVAEALRRLQKQMPQVILTRKAWAEAGKEDDYDELIADEIERMRREAARRQTKQGNHPDGGRNHQTAGSLNEREKSIVSGTLKAVASVLKPMLKRLDDIEDQNKQAAGAGDYLSAGNKDLMSAIMTVVIGAIKPVHERLDALEPRVAQLEHAQPLEYKGVWRRGYRAESGEFWTYQGSVWHAKCATTATPGTAPEAWQLAVKRGRDGGR